MISGNIRPETLSITSVERLIQLFNRLEPRIAALEAVSDIGGEDAALQILRGGTGATTAAGARENLGAASTDAATVTDDGLMSAADKKKVDAMWAAEMPPATSTARGGVRVREGYGLALEDTDRLGMSLATPEAAGAMSAADKVRLDGINDSPVFTGIPTAPTPAANNNSDQIATTAYVDRASTGGGGNPLALDALGSVINIADNAGNAAWLRHRGDIIFAKPIIQEEVDLCGCTLAGDISVTGIFRSPLNTARAFTWDDGESGYWDEWEYWELIARLEAFIASRQWLSGYYRVMANWSIEGIQLAMKEGMENLS